MGHLQNWFSDFSKSLLWLPWGGWAVGAKVEAGRGCSFYRDKLITGSAHCLLSGKVSLGLAQLLGYLPGEIETLTDLMGGEAALLPGVWPWVRVAPSQLGALRLSLLSPNGPSTLGEPRPTSPSQHSVVYTSTVIPVAKIFKYFIFGW